MFRKPDPQVVSIDMETSVSINTDTRVFEDTDASIAIEVTGVFKGISNTPDTWRGRRAVKKVAEIRSALLFPLLLLG